MNSQPITIIDIGISNTGSVVNMLKRIGTPSILANTAEHILQAKKIIFPGVGSFDRAMEKISELNLREALEEMALQKHIPFLGVCLGMQLLTEGSEEGQLPGLGWVSGRTKRFRFPEGSNLKIPHMGWNEAQPRSSSAVFDQADQKARYYFVHSYFVECDDSDDIAATTDYGGQFTSALQHQNIYGVQFHPEKSLRHGMRVLENFAKL